MITTIDFETRSPIDLKKQGVFPYANHALTEIMCLSVAIDDRSPLIWAPDHFKDKIDVYSIKYEMAPEDYIVDLVVKSERVIAFNSMFEYVIWNRVGKRRGWPELSLYRMHDVMAQCGYFNFPQNLAKAGDALNLAVQKDDAGHKAMLKLCKPRRPVKDEREGLSMIGAKELDDNLWETPDGLMFCHWHEDREDLETLLNYCAKDVETERLLCETLPPLPEQERDVWLLDQEINLRGVKVDLVPVARVVKAIERQNKIKLKEFTELTGGAVSSPRAYKALRDWVNEKIYVDIVTDDAGNVIQGGYYIIDPVDSVDKNATEELLKNKDLPHLLRQVMEIKSELSKSSVAKLKAMVKRVDIDGRIKGMFQYGAAGTLRWAGRGVQLHNLPRESYSEKEWGEVVELFLEGNTQALELFYDPPYKAASKLVRGSLIPNVNKDLMVADFSSIEGRGLAYLANEYYALEAYREGADPYKIAAESIFNVNYNEVDKPQRQVGKVSELAFGYGGGIGAYASMAAGYGIDLETLPPFITHRATEAEWKSANNIARGYMRKHPKSMSLDAAIACDIIKQKWRANRPETVKFWYAIENTVVNALREPGKIFAYGKIKYVFDGNFLKCLLPSGRLMFYYLPDIRDIKRHTYDIEGHDKKCMCDECAEWQTSITYMGMKTVEGGTTTGWTRVPTYGGSLVENIVQAFCRDILAYAMLNVKKAGYNIVLHVHDEIGVEVPRGTGDLDKFCKIMSQVPEWAYGMPIEADGYIGKRYRK